MLNNCKTLFFVGIGGVHMSGMAELLLSSGHTIAGSDKKSSAATERLVKKGAVVYIGHDVSHITKDIDIVVYTAAVPHDNPELAAARAMGITVMERAEMLGLIMKNYKYPICISGTHGKTTTTSMLTDIFRVSEKNPTSLIGGLLPSIGGSLSIGSDNNDYFIVVTIRKNIGVVNNYKLHRLVVSPTNLGKVFDC